MEWMDYLYETIRKNLKKRKIVIYRYLDGTKMIRDELQKRGVEIAFFVDYSAYQLKKVGVFKPDILKNHSSEFYVIIPFLEHSDMIETLREFGYSEGDYVYSGSVEYRVLHEDANYFEDNYGNQIFASSEIRSQIQLKGFHSKVVIPENCVFSQQFRLSIRNHSVFQVGKETCLHGKFTIEDCSTFQCGERCVFANDGHITMNEAEIKIGDDLTTENNFRVYSLRNSSIIVGDDCNLSHGIVMRTNDSHTIFDLETGKNINSTEEICRNRRIQIGNHVWIGQDVFILYNSKIEDGSIIGARSLVKSKIPNNCIAAGVPARVIRRNVAWSRNNNALDWEAECDEKYWRRTIEIL